MCNPKNFTYDRISFIARFSQKHKSNMQEAKHIAMRIYLSIGTSSYSYNYVVLSYEAMQIFAKETSHALIKMITII